MKKEGAMMGCNLRQMAESCKANFPLAVSGRGSPRCVAVGGEVLLEMSRLIGHVMMYKTALG